MEGLCEKWHGAEFPMFAGWPDVAKCSHRRRAQEREAELRPPVATPSNPASGRRLALIGAPQAVDVELDHAHHRLHRALRAGLVGSAEIFWQRGRHDLPRHAVAILQPAALLGSSAIPEQ